MRKVICLLMMLSTALASGQIRRELTEEETKRKKRFRQAVILPFKFTRDHGAENGELSMLQIRPLYTITTESYNFINRPIIPIIGLNGEVGGRPDLPNNGIGEESAGLGDITYTVAVEARRMKPLSVALGAAASFPTATSDRLGTGKWSAGPAVMLIGTRNNLSMLVQARQLWSFAGDPARSEVNNLVIEPIFTYKLKPMWYLFTDPIVSANWQLTQGDRWVVPVGAGAGHLFRIGGQLMDLKLEAYYNAVRPDNAPTWSASFTFSLIFKKQEKSSP